MRKNNYLFSMTIIGMLFFVFGFITWLNSVLIPFLKQVCQLTDFEAYFVTFAFYISYFIMALPSSWILKKTGFTKGMSLGLFVMAIGSLIFIPAAKSGDYILFLIGLFGQGAGLALLQTASNPYVTILGPIESAAQRISIMGICNKVAGMIGVFLLSMILFGNMTELSTQINAAQGAEKALLLNQMGERIILPYIGIAIGLTALGVMILFSKLPKIKPEESVEEKDGKLKSIFRFPYLWLGVLGIFLYVGVEVIAIDTLPLYAESQGIRKEVASKLATYCLIALTVGYLLGIVTVPKYLSQSKALVVCAVLDIAFAVAALLTNGVTSIVFIILLSFAHSLMWPGIWPLAIEKLGRHTETASALLIMGIAGGALMPLLYGAFADYLHNLGVENYRQIPYVILIPCYLYLIFFAVKGHKIGKAIEKSVK